ncbi:MAG: hypothetical protein K0R34_2542 [Herbinix sp.]|jgi:uncharacterized membrane protein|nr:hypothetical protein [Herbinix sp.]
MDTIRNYLDNIFANLPKTGKVLELKNNILSNMEDKYNELKRQGKTENEAIGIVISEFGNIDELISELGIQANNETPSQPLVTADEVEEYLKVKKVMGLQIGIGTFLCILAPAILILLSVLVENGVIFASLNENAAYVPGLIILFVLIATAVGIFIFSGMNFERFKFMEEGVQLPMGVADDLKKRHEAFNPTFYLCIVVGFCLCIISPVSLFLSSMISDDTTEYGVFALLVIIAIAVFLFISAGTVRESYEKLLRIGDFAPKKKEDKVIGAVAACVWPLAVAVFLFCGFVYNLWYIAWVIFPITGILFGMFSAVYSIVTDKDRK